MQFTSFLDNGNLTVALTGEIDHHRAKHYIHAISAKIEAYTPAQCVLDFSEVTFVDSSGIAVVINALRCMNMLGGKLLLCGIAQQPMKVFRAAGIDKLVEIYVRINQECENPEVLERCRNNFKLLEEGDEFCVNLWKEFSDLSLKEFDKIYDLLGIKFDSVKGESFYIDKMQEVVDILEKNNIIFIIKKVDFSSTLTLFCFFGCCVV